MTSGRQKREPVFLQDKMEERLIVAVCGHPELYDTASYWYRDRTKKDNAWRRVSEDVGEPEDVCRRKWKGLRDTYLKERRKVTQEKRSGSAAGTSKRWKFSVVMSFLDPFITPRDTSSNMVQGVEEELATETGQPSETGDENTQGEGVGEGEDVAGAADDGGASVGAAAASPAGTSAAQTSGKRSKMRPSRGDMDRAIMEALRRPPPPPSPPPPPPPTQDELFFKSLLPAMEKVAPARRDYVRSKMYQFIVENQEVVD